MINTARTRARTRALPGILVATAAISLAGCATSPAPPAASNADESESPSVTISTDITDYLVSMSMIHADAPVFENSDELVEVSQIGAIGEVAEFADGVLFTEGDEFEFEPVIARLENVELLSGELPAGFDGSLYVALPGFQSAEEYAAAIAPGTRMVAYGNDLAGETTTVRAGAPADQAIINVAHPAGLGLEVQGVDAASRSAVPDVPVLVFPLESAVAPDMTAEDLAPGNPLPNFDDLEHGDGTTTE